MRNQKYLLIGSDGETLALRRDNVTYVTFIGGNGKFIDLMSEIVQKVFKRKLPRAHWVTANKVKFKFLTKTGDWDVARKTLEESGYTLTKVNSVGRVMR